MAAEQEDGNGCEIGRRGDLRGPGAIGDFKTRRNNTLQIMEETTKDDKMVTEEAVAVSI